MVGLLPHNARSTDGVAGEDRHSRQRAAAAPSGSLNSPWMIAQAEEDDKRAAALELELALALGLGRSWLPVEDAGDCGRIG
jgi:hypothetical protein